MNRYTCPEACLTGTITTAAVVSLVDFGFDAAMVARSRYAAIYVHNSKILVKWAQDYPRVAPTVEVDYDGNKVKTEAAPVPATNDGHGIGAETERVVLGKQALWNLRMIATGSNATVTITLEG